ncbi:MAG TPA: acyl-CoA dehydrogenase [bacterium]|nr:acyl-CoA dehydrogenase [bacterium]
MDYKVDFEDVLFTLFDFLKPEQLASFPRFQGQTSEMYRQVLEEGLKFAKNELAPLNERGDRVGAKVVDGRVKMPEGFKGALDQFGQNGFMSIDLNPEFGGMGLPTLVNTALSEFIMGACPSFAFFHLLTRGDCNMMQAFASKELNQIYLPKMTSGEWCGTMCLTEPQAGSAVGDLTTVAKKNPDGSFSIQGTKIFITCGDHDLTPNIVHLVLARIDGDAAGTKGISLFVVPSKRVNADGSLGADNDVKLVSIEHKMGIKASPTCLLQFGDKGQCRGFLVGKPMEGMKYMFQLMNEARLAVGQQGVAIAGPAYEHALGYAKERTQGGKTLIIDYPDVRRMLMTMKAYVEALRCLILEAGLFVDIGWHHPDAHVREEYEGYLGLMTPVCKAFGSDMGFRVTELAIQTYGGYGYVSDYPVEQSMRDLKIASLYEGTNGIQAMDLIGRKFLKNAGENLKKYLGHIAGQLKKAAETPELKPLADKGLAAVDRFGKAAQHIAKNAGDAAYVGLSATPFLRAFGDVICSSLLIRKAALAAQQLAGKPNAERTKFLQGKIEVARFYVEQILPEMDANLARVVTTDKSALADVL